MTQGASVQEDPYRPPASDPELPPVRSDGRRTPNAEEEGRLKRWRLSTFMVMLFGYVGYYLCRKNLSAALPLLEDVFGYTNTQLAYIGSFSTVAYAVGKFINGPLGDKLGGRRIFLLGMAGAIVFNVIFALSASLAEVAAIELLVVFVAVWCFNRFFLSMGWGGIAKTIGAWYEPERNGTVMGWISINFQFGGVAAVMFAGLLVWLGAGWQGLFFYPAIVLTLVWVWSYLASRASPDDVVPDTTFGSGATEQVAGFGEESPGVVTILKTLLKLPIFRHLLAFSFLTTFLRAVFIFWTIKFLADLGMGNSSAIIKSALFPFLGCVGTVLLGWYTDRFARNGDRAQMMWIMLVGLVASLLGLAALAGVEDPPLDLIVVLIGACGFFLLGPYSMSSGCLSLDIAGSKGAGSCTGLIDGVGYIGAAIAIFMAGKISDELGWSEVFAVLAGVAVLAVGSAWLMSRMFQRMAAERRAAAVD